jgi:hypothetical protein
MIAHYEHILAKPSSYYGPLSDFLELGKDQQQVSYLHAPDIYSRTISPKCYLGVEGSTYRFETTNAQ